MMTSSMTSTTGLGSDKLRAAWFHATGLLRPGAQALIAPHALAVQAKGRALAVVRQRTELVGKVEEQFNAAVVDLLQMIDHSGLHGLRWRVVVSDFWARPLIVPLSGPLPSDRDVDVMLESQFRRTYGDLMEGWRWCWTRQADQLLAVAWPSLGWTTLCDGLALRSGSVASAKPLATDVVAKASADSASSWLAIIERQSVTLIRRQDGQWLEWRVMPADSDLAVALPLQLAREVARRRDECRTVSLLELSGTADGRRIRQALLDAGWRVQPGAANESDRSQAGRLSRAINTGAA